LWTFLPHQTSKDLTMRKTHLIDKLTTRSAKRTSQSWGSVKKLLLIDFPHPTSSTIKFRNQINKTKTNFKTQHYEL
jgi:hypothetical protein